MSEHELENTRVVKSKDNIKRINELKAWFRFDYPNRLNKINRYAYLGLPMIESRYSLEIEAYNKENELRILNGETPLPPLKYTNLL